MKPALVSFCSSHAGQIYGMSRPVARYIAQVRPLPVASADAACAACQFLSSTGAAHGTVAARSLLDAPWWHSPLTCLPRVSLLRFDTRLVHLVSRGRATSVCGSGSRPCAEPRCAAAARACSSPPRRTRPSCTGMPTRTWRWVPGWWDWTSTTTTSAACAATPSGSARGRWGRGFGVMAPV